MSFLPVLLRVSRQRACMQTLSSLGQQTRIPWRSISSSCSSRASDRNSKDSDVKSILSDIYGDFEKLEGIKKPIEEEKVGEAKKPEVEKEGEAKKKDLKDLLAQIYEEEEENEENTSLGMDGYSRFRDQDARVIYDIEEERQILKEALESGKPLILEKEKKMSVKYKYEQITETHGERGVFEVDEMLTVLKGEKLMDIVVIRIPAVKQYADYLVIATGRNARHIYVGSQTIKKLYKKKSYADEDASPCVAGAADRGDSGWIAMDLGNIVVHLFTQEERDYYDLETLWTVGSRYDDLSQTAPDTLSKLMFDHLAGLEPQEQLQLSPRPARSSLKTS